MTDGGTKRIVVIRDIPSNMIEEAIFILRNDREEGSNGKSIPKKNKIKHDNEFILKEAQTIISSYMKENKWQAAIRRKPGAKPLTPNKKFLTNLIINIALIGSIALMIFLVSRII